MTDMTTLTDAELADLEAAVLAEMARRQNRVAIPATIADLAHKYIESGGDPADLQHAITA